MIEWNSLQEEDNTKSVEDKLPGNLLDMALRFHLVSVSTSPRDRSNLFSKSLANAMTVVWILVPREDISPECFWDHFCRATSAWSTRLAMQLEKMGVPREGIGEDAIPGLFRRARKEHGEPVFLVNHSQYFVSNAVRNFLNRLIEQTASEVSYIVLLQEEWDFSFPALPEPVRAPLRDIVCSREEIFHILLNWLGTALDGKQLDLISEVTGGWAPAIFLLGTQLKRDLPLEHQGIRQSLENLRRIVDKEFLSKLQADIRHSLVLLSLLTEFSLELMEKFTPITRDAFLQINRWMPFFHCSHPGETYTIQPLLKYYLTAEQSQLSCEERSAFLIHTGQWYEARHLLPQPMIYFMQANAYDQVGRFLSQLSILTLPLDLCAEFDGLIDHIPASYLDKYPLLFVYHVLICYRLDDTYKAKVVMNRLWMVTHNKGEECGGNAGALGEYHFLNAIFNWRTGREFIFDLEQASKYLPEGSRIFGHKPWGMVGTNSCLPLGGVLPMAELVSQYRQAVPFANAVMGSFGKGAELLAECEASFYRCELEAALLHGGKAIQKAVSFQQWDIAAFAAFICMRACVAKGSWSDVNNYRKICRDYSDRSHSCLPTSVTIADMANATMHYVIKNRTPFRSQKKTAKGERKPLGNGNYRTGQEVFIHCLTENYRDYELLEMVNLAVTCCTSKFQWITKLKLLILRALLYLSLQHYTEAVAQLENCYQISRQDDIVVLFGEFGAHMKKLIHAVRENTLHSIPSQWLDRVDKTAALFESGMKTIRAEYFRSGTPSIPPVPMTRREREVYALLCTGKSISDIAREMNIGVSTVRSTLSHAYKKLGVKNRREAQALAQSEEKI